MTNGDHIQVGNIDGKWIIIGKDIYNITVNISSEIAKYPPLQKTVKAVYEDNDEDVHKYFIESMKNPEIHEEFQKAFNPEKMLGGINEFFQTKEDQLEMDQLLIGIAIRLMHRYKKRSSFVAKKMDLLEVNDEILSQSDRLDLHNTHLELQDLMKKITELCSTLVDLMKKQPYPIQNKILKDLHDS